MIRKTLLIILCVLASLFPSGGTYAGNARYFHIDDFSGLGGSYAPLQGSKSLWCGLRPTHPDASGYVSAPGYGNNWEEIWQSCFFRVSNDVQVNYTISWDTEPNRDYIYFDYLNKTGAWVNLASYQGTGSISAMFTIPISNLNGAVRFRFLFISNASGSDEDGGYDTDGACIIDQITVKDGSTIINQEDFEAESVGDRIALSSMWAAGVPPGCGSPCVKPPQDMKAWWPLDEPSGFWAYDNAGPDDALHRCYVIPLPGKVSGAKRFTMADANYGYAYVEYPSGYLDLGSSSFTIDAWIYPEPCSMLYTYMQSFCHRRPILTKRTANYGYDFFVDNDVNDGSLDGKLGVGLNATEIISTTRVIKDSEWQHVAVRIDRGANLGTFFYNGIAFETFVPPAGSVTFPWHLHLGHGHSGVIVDCEHP